MGSSKHTVRIRRTEVIMWEHGILWGNVPVYGFFKAYGIHSVFSKFDYDGIIKGYN